MAFLYDSRMPTPPMTSTFARRKADDYIPAAGSQVSPAQYRYTPTASTSTQQHYTLASTSTGGYQYSTQTYQQQQHYPQTQQQTQTHTPVEHQHYPQNSSASGVYEQGQQQQRPTLPSIAHLERNLPPLTPPDDICTSTSGPSHPRVEDDVFMGAPSSSVTTSASTTTHNYNQQSNSPYHPPSTSASSSQHTSSSYSYPIPASTSTSTTMSSGAVGTGATYPKFPVHPSAQPQSQSHSPAYQASSSFSSSQNALYVQQQQPPPQQQQQYHLASQALGHPQQQPQQYYSSTQNQAQYQPTQSTSQSQSQSHSHSRTQSQSHPAQYHTHTHTQTQPNTHSHTQQYEQDAPSSFPAAPVSEVEPDSALALLPSSSFVSSSSCSGPGTNGPGYINGSGTGSVPAVQQHAAAMPTSASTAMPVANASTAHNAGSTTVAVEVGVAAPTMGRNPSTTNGLVVVDWLDFTRTRSAHFIAEKTCEMICYLWFAASGGSVSALGRRQREGEREREKSRERERREKSRERERETQDSAMDSMSTPPPTPPSKRRLLSAPGSGHGGGSGKSSSRASASPTNGHASISTSNSISTSVAPSAPSTLQLIATPTFVAFMQKLLETTQVSQSVIVLSLHYIYRLKERSRFTPAQAGSEFRIAVAGLMMANKFLDDNTYTNKTWSEVSGIELAEINRMEREFLQGVDFNLYVDIATYQTWLNLLKGLVLAKERDCRRWAYGRHGAAAGSGSAARRGGGGVVGQRPMAHVGGAGSRSAAYANANAARRGSTANVQPPMRSGSYGNLAPTAKVYASSSAASAAFKSQQAQAQQRQQQQQQTTAQYQQQPQSQSQTQQHQYRSLSTSPTPLPRAVYMPYTATPVEQAPSPAAPAGPVVERDEIVYPPSSEPAYVAPAYYAQQQQPSAMPAPAPGYNVQAPPAPVPAPIPAQQYTLTPVTTTATLNTHLRPHIAHSYDEDVIYNSQTQAPQAQAYVSTGNPYPPSYPSYPHSAYASYPSGTSSAYTSPSPAPSAVHLSSASGSSAALASRQPPLGMARLNTALAQQAQAQSQAQAQAQQQQAAYMGTQAQQAHIQGVLQRKRTAEAAFSPTSVAFRDADVQLPPSKTRVRPVSLSGAAGSISLRIPEGLRTPGGASSGGVSAGASASPLDGFSLQSFSRMSLGGSGAVSSPAREREDKERERERERERDWESGRLAAKTLSSTYTYATDERRAAAPQNLYFYTLACSPLKEEPSGDKDGYQEVQKEDGSGYGYRKARLRYHQPNLSANAPYPYADLNASSRGVGVPPQLQVARPHTSSYPSHSQPALSATLPPSSEQAQYSYPPASATADTQRASKHLHPHYHQSSQPRVAHPNAYPSSVHQFQTTPPRLVVQSAVSSPTMMRTRPNFGSSATLPIFRDDVWARPPAPAHSYEQRRSESTKMDADEGADEEVDEESASEEEDDDEDMDDVEDDDEEEDEEEEDEEDAVYTRSMLSSKSSASTIKYSAPQEPRTPPSTTTSYSYSQGASSYSNANVPSAPFANAGPPGVGVRFYDDQAGDINSSPLRPSTHHAASYHYSTGQYYQQQPALTHPQQSYGQTYGAYTGNGVYGYIPSGGGAGLSGYTTPQR